MVGCSHLAALFRSPAGLFWQGKRKGDVLTDLRAVKVLVPGFPDLCGFRRSDGKAVYIEVKTATGRVSPEQQHFIEVARKAGALAGIARSVEDALEIVKGDPNANPSPNPTHQKTI